jgi:putative membrane protein insertion efficiency factor
MPTTAPSTTSSKPCCAGRHARVGADALPPEGREALGPGARVALGLLRAYKVAVSPLFAGACRYLPSCSDYAAEAIRTHGALRGMFLAAGRLARCQPFGGSGYDPVPPRPVRVSTEGAGPHGLAR